MRLTVLTPEQMVEIDRRHALGESIPAIAAAVGCKRSHVWFRVDPNYRMDAYNRTRKRRGLPMVTLAEYEAMRAKTQKSPAARMALFAASPHEKNCILTPPPIEAVRKLKPFIGWKAPTCQWPTWPHDARPNHKFCGAPTVEGHSYCAHHRGMAYLAGSSMRDMDRERKRPAQQATRGLLMANAGLVT